MSRVELWKRSKALNHVPLLAVSYSLAVALDDSTRKYQRKKEVRRKYKKEGGKRKRSGDKMLSRIPVMLALSCVSNR